MVVAVAKALEAGARAIICASTGNTSASAAAYGAAAGLEVVVVLPRRPDRGRQAAPGADGRRARRRRRGQLRRRAADRARAAPSSRTARPPADARELGQPTPHRRPEDGRLRDLRGPRRRARLPRHPGRQRRQHHGLLAGLQRVPRRGPGRRRARSCSASRRPAPRRSSSATASTTPETVATAIRIGDPASVARR